MKTLGIDIETYSSYDLTKCGVYRYVESPDFAILLFAYCIDGGAVQCVDFAQGESLPQEVMFALTDAGVTKTAYNAMFERVCIGHWLGQTLDAAQWECTMAKAARMGLPLSLAKCGEALGLQQQKMREGTALINFFSKPDRNGQRRMPTASWDRWETFKAYNIRDVEVEQEILKRVSRLEVPTWEQELYVIDQRINDRGVLIDRQMAENAARMDEEYKEELRARARELTGIENPDSTSQIKDWLKQRTGISVSTLNKASIDDLDKKLIYWKDAQELIAIRKQLGKTSNKKYPAMLNCVCNDGRIHGLLQYYGSRTGRWAGRLVQVQNLPQNHLPDIDTARELVKQGDLDELEMNYANVPQVLSELIRTAFVAKAGHVFHVCDFSAIEARVIAWLAGEKWVLDVFRNGGDIYCATASQMFGIPVEKHGQNAELRQRGKVAVLALGYGGGKAALEAMGGARLGLSEDEMLEIVKLWRGANKHITDLWRRLETLAVNTINNQCKNWNETNRGVRMAYRWGCLLVGLPSDRILVYPRARIGVEHDARGEHDCIEYEGQNQTTGKWETIRTYGGKLTENIIQAIARDILATVILRAESNGMNVVFHIHDEIVVEADPNKTTLKEIEELFSKPINWCEDLPLKGAGYSTPYYLKD